MRLEVSPDIFEMFPGYVRYVLHAVRANNTRTEDELMRMLAAAQASVREDRSFEDLKSNPRIASWRSAFERFGVNPNQCPPSIANLIKRVRGGKDLPYINTLVCVFNVVSLTHVLPAGGDDLDKVVGDVRLGLALGDEVYTPLGSPDRTENPKAGEVILYDTGSGDAFCRAWCWKNGDRSRIEESTSRVAINIDVLPPVTPAQGQAAAEETAELVCRFCGAQVEIYRLAKENPSAEIA